MTWRSHRRSGSCREDIVIIGGHEHADNGVVPGMAWASANGDYIVSDSPGFNPNVGDNIEWTRLQAEQ